MNTSLSIDYDISRHPSAASSYRLSMGQTDEPVTGGLARRGDTYNNIVSYRGVFATQTRAVQAALEYLDCSVRLVELNCGGEIRVVLQPATDRMPKLDEFTTARVLGSRTQRGMFIASADAG